MRAGGGSPIQRYLESLVEDLRGLDAGQVATYIPELGLADPSWFAVCLCTTDGAVYEVGDAAAELTIQSISKPFVYGTALDQHGREAVHRRVGVEPSGNPFNAIQVDDTNRPFNPMVNAGAIVTTALVDSDETILAVLSRCAGRELHVDDAVYRSEYATGHRNRAIAHLMLSFGAIDSDPDVVVDRYFRQCSVAVTCADLAVMAGTLANRGRNPVSGELAIEPAHVASVLSVMSTCGMYDASGDWIYRVGLPAKSGVSGGLIAVLPGQFGIAVFSPRLDARGNTTRGVAVCTRIATDLGLHPLASQPDAGVVVRRSYSCAKVRSTRLRSRAELDVLEEHGSRICVVELQGDLAFGTAERVVRQALDVCGAADIVVLDVNRVSNVDDGARRVLEELEAALEADGRALVFADAREGRDLATTLEWCEDQLLQSRAPEAIATTRPLPSQDLLMGLSELEVAAIAARTTERRLGAGEVLVTKGDVADSLFFILEGRLAVMLRNGGAAGEATHLARPDRRVATLGPGMTVGELALASSTERSADVVAVHDSVVAELTLAAIEQCCEAHPRIALQLRTNLARELAERLRRANDQLGLLTS